MRATRSLLSSSGITRLAGAMLVAVVLAGCQADEIGYGPKHLREVSMETRAAMAKLGMDKKAPVLMRIFKEENVFEVWKQTPDGRYALLKTYEICKWSGELGPKFKEGDRQAPEGYYAITQGLMNPNSQYYLAFNTGFPNAYDRSHGRTGTHLMVHGACSSRGCYAMTDEQIQEIYALARDAFSGGQKAFQLQAYPFRMTAENMGRHWDSPHMPFWKMLKEGYDTFELTRREPKVDVCGRKYVFNATPKGDMSPVDACPELVKPPELEVALARKAAEDEAKAEVVFAALQEKRKADEAREIMIAQRLEDERRRAEERASQPPGTALASLFNLGGGQASAAASTAGAAPVPGSPAVEAEPAAVQWAGAPMPRPDPRGADTPALALAAPEPAAPGMFSRLFRLGDEAPAEPPTAAPSAQPGVEEAARIAVPAAATAAAVTTAGTAPARIAAASQAAGGTAPACASPGDPSCPPVDAPVAARPAPPAEPLPDADQGILARIGNWF